MEEKTTPGARVKVIGVLKEVPVPLKTGGISTKYELSLEANNLIPLEETFEELETLLLSCGYKKLEGKGSAVKFYHEEIDNLINLHKPHPSNILKTYLVKQIQIKLKEVCDG